MDAPDVVDSEEARLELELDSGDSGAVEEVTALAFRTICGSSKDFSLSLSCRLVFLFVFLLLAFFLCNDLNIPNVILDING